MIKPERGEVWRVFLDPTVGDEIGKARPAIVMSESETGRLALRVVVPLTGWQSVFAKHPWMTDIAPNEQNGLSKPSSADAFQVRSVSLNRFISKIGELEPDEVEEVAASITLVVGYLAP